MYKQHNEYCANIQRPHIPNTTTLPLRTTYLPTASPSPHTPTTCPTAHPRRAPTHTNRDTSLHYNQQSHLASTPPSHAYTTSARSPLKQDALLIQTHKMHAQGAKCMILRENIRLCTTWQKKRAGYSIPSWILSCGLQPSPKTSLQTVPSDLI